MPQLEQVNSSVVHMLFAIPATSLLNIFLVDGRATRGGVHAGQCSEAALTERCGARMRFGRAR
jgi:hypothetical protein